jgi:DNA gyrase subunit B
MDKILSNNEIRTIITALGAGIGKEDYDIARLRYHKTIIMTDADVDGSHIRTLLLTLFYRHFPEMVEKGHVFIAQPPLYRVGKGKEEHYIRTEEELTRFFVQRAVEIYTVSIPAARRSFKGPDLAKVLEALQRYERLLSRMERKGYSAKLLHVLFAEGLCRELFADLAKVEDLANLLRREGFEVGAMDFDEEHSLYEFTAKDERLPGPAHVNHALHHASEYITVQNLHELLKDFDRPPFKIQNGEGVQEAPDRRALLEMLMGSVKAKYHVQRYKGLGEMNPEQLWETTMDPSKRRLLQVRIEDAVEADALFSILMGDAVEPRRRFIEENALNVTNLDI